ncbi:HYC_CC_PP family protein [Tamlana sp. I1]|uniref:HYC_CC_PP family protein n=1 Tax=Tamlana sp. I1 TaxID=2762061 RepID=UPI00188F62B7|nr:hypothetical protein [Tamlana sp. I1]
MKKVFRKIASLLMAFVVLFSTMSFAVNMHYCGDKLVDASIFHNAETCGMEMNALPVEGCEITKKDCCNDVQVVVDGQDELQVSLDKITFEQQLFVASFIYTYINLFEGLDKNVASFEAYNAPHVIRQIFKLDESFLI